MGIYYPYINKKLLSHKRAIGEKVKKFRRGKHLTLKEVASRSGISIAHVSEIERGRVSPTVGTMGKLATGFGKPISFFLELISPGVKNTGSSSRYLIFLFSSTDKKSFVCFNFSISSSLSAE